MAHCNLKLPDSSDLPALGSLWAWATTTGHLLRRPSVPLPTQGSGLASVIRWLSRGRAGAALGAALLGWGSQTVALMTSTPCSLCGCFRVPGCPLCHWASLPCDFCFCSCLPSFGSEEGGRGIPRPFLGSWAWGLLVPSSAREPGPPLSLLPAEGEVRRRGAKDPAFWARKAEKSRSKSSSGASGH